MSTTSEQLHPTTTTLKTTNRQLPGWPPPAHGSVQPRLCPADQLNSPIHPSRTVAQTLQIRWCLPR
jgi:hypothetical protein